MLSVLSDCKVHEDNNDLIVHLVWNNNIYSYHDCSKKLV